MTHDVLRPQATRAPDLASSRTSASLTRREFVLRLAGAGAAMVATSALSACGGGAGTSNAVATLTSLSAATPLRTAAQGANLLFGAATHTWNLLQDADFAAQVARHCSLLVPEDELKWDTVEPSPGVFDFSPGDWLCDFASQHDMQFRGHCLVWHKQVPQWAGRGTASEVQAQLTDHIATTVQHFAGRVHSWDVVNEAVEPADKRADGLRNNLFLQALGPSYIDVAFHAAADADPTALLVYNDYGLEGDLPDSSKRRAAVLNLLSGMKSRGVPVHALGLQAHLGGGSFDTGALSSFLRQVAALGLKILVTELDVRDQKMSADPGNRDQSVADLYRKFLSTVLQQPAVEAVLTWGLSDRYTWLTQFAPRSDGQSVRPLPLDSALASKPALAAMLDAFNAAPRR